MKGFRVVGLSEKGERALMSQIEELKKQPIHARMMFARIFIRETTEKPVSEVVSLTIRLKNPVLASMLNPEDFIKKINESFTEKECKESEDYIVEVF